MKILLNFEISRKSYIEFNFPKELNCINFYLLRREIEEVMKIRLHFGMQFKTLHRQQSEAFLSQELGSSALYVFISQRAK